MPIEFEYKYLVEKIPDCFVERESHYYIEQFYFVMDDDRFMSSRARKIVKSSLGEGDTLYTEFILTNKIGKGSSVMEVECPITSQNYSELKSNFIVGNVITKTRSVINIDGNKWELDIFGNGDVIAEIENPPMHLTIPSEFGKYVDVTNDPKYKNVNIAKYGFPPRYEF
jgi:CYTH domain-containing protein